MKLTTPQIIPRLMLVLLCSFWTGGASASLKDTLDSMFSSNVSPPSSYSSAMRNGFVGGNMTFKAPIKPINLVSFDPPRFSAGCGGIDMYGGSFNFINKTQFTALIRAIIANATGLIFQTALQSISPPLAALSKEFQKDVQDLNSMMKNTCAIAHGVVDDLKNPDNIKSQLDQAVGAVGTAMGTIGSDIEQVITAPFQKSATAKAVESKISSGGNLTWKALSRSQTDQSIGVVGQVVTNDPTGALARQLLMSMIGTEINTSHQTNQDGSTKAAPSCSSLVGDGSDGACTASDGTDVLTYGRAFKVNELVSPNSSPDGSYKLPLYLCSGVPDVNDSSSTDSNSCLAITKSTYDFPGTDYYVRNMFYGNDLKTDSASIVAAVNASSPSSPDPSNNSILGKLMNCNGSSNCSLTPAEMQFLNMAGPVYKLVKETQHSPESMPMLINYIVPYMAENLAVNLGTAAESAARHAWDAVKDVTKTKNIDDNIKAMDVENRALMTVVISMRDDIFKAQTIANEIRKAISIPGK